MLMRARSSPQLGSFVLEALVAALIVALGVLGIVGMFAHAAQNVDDSKYRGEAALLAHSLVGQMWVGGHSSADLQSNFDSASPGTGPGYVEFRTLVLQRLPHSLAPDVLITAGPTATSSDVLITVKWTHPGDKPDPILPQPRRYDMHATIGSNP